MLSKVAFESCFCTFLSLINIELLLFVCFLFFRLFCYVMLCCILLLLFLGNFFSLAIDGLFSFLTAIVYLKDFRIKLKFIFFPYLKVLFHLYIYIHLNIYKNLSLKSSVSLPTYWGHFGLSKHKAFAISISYNRIIFLMVIIIFFININFSQSN